MNEATVKDIFAKWLREGGWEVRAVKPVDADIKARKGKSWLIAEVKGDTSSPGTDIDTGYGQLLRRMSDIEGDDCKFALVVSEGIVKLAHRVLPQVRQKCGIDLFVVTGKGKVTPG